MLRALFEKTGTAIWISHLDTMRLFQRAFKRAGLHLKHTQGYNPRPSVSIALPLSVGVESFCELLDFELDGDMVSCEQIRDRLNEALVAGVRVREVYEGGRKLRDLALLSCRIGLQYDGGVEEEIPEALAALFARQELVVEKRSKNGTTEQNILPMIRRLELHGDGKQVFLDCLICCQNPTLNPMQLPAAIEKYLPRYRPDFVRIGRLELYDAQETIFR